MAPSVTFPDHSGCNALTSLVHGDSSNPPGARQRAPKRGQSLWLSEAPFDRVYHLAAGHVSIIGADETGRELLLRTVAAGDWFGDYCLCPGEKMPHPALEARADEDCQLVEVRHDRWLRDLASSAAAVREFVTRACLRLAQADRRLVMMAPRSADERIGMLLLEHADTDLRHAPRGSGTVMFATTRPTSPRGTIRYRAQKTIFESACHTPRPQPDTITLRARAQLAVTQSRVIDQSADAATTAKCEDEECFAIGLTGTSFNAHTTDRIANRPQCQVRSGRLVRSHLACAAREIGIDRSRHKVLQHAHAETVR
jgi:CRP-like cAMP-binding protein